MKIDITEKRNRQIHNYTWKLPHSTLNPQLKKETEIQQGYKRFLKNTIKNLTELKFIGQFTSQSRIHILKHKEHSPR